MKHFETSAKANIGIEDSLKEIVTQAYEVIREAEEKSSFHVTSKDVP